MKPSLSTMMCSFLHPLRRFFPDDQGPSPWMDRPVLSTTRCRGWLLAVTRFRMGFSFTLLLDKVLWSGTGRRSFISSNRDKTKPSACLSGRWKSSLKVRTVSIARSAYFRCLPCLLDFAGVHDFMAAGESQIVRLPLFLRDSSYWLQLMTLYFCLYFGLLLLLCASFIMNSPDW